MASLSNLRVVIVRLVFVAERRHDSSATKKVPEGTLGSLLSSFHPISLRIVGFAQFWSARLRIPVRVPKNSAAL